MTDAVTTLASVEQTVLDGPLLLAALLAVAAGLVSFFSPCVLPLVPGYLSYVAGLAGATTRTAERVGASAPAAPDASPPTAATAPEPRAVRRRMLAGSLLFVAGFTVVFVSFGAAFGGLGRLLAEHQRTVSIVLGAITVVLGLAFLGAIPPLAREFRLRRLPPAGLAGAPLLGVVFGLGWTPCLGPTLGAVNVLAFSEGSAGRGAWLGVAYCLGLGIPFVLTALGAGRALRVSGWARRHARTITRVGGALLVVIGLLLVTGAWDLLMNQLRAWIAQFGLNETFL